MFYITLIFLLVFSITDIYKRIIPNTLLGVMFLVVLWVNHVTLLEFLIGLIVSALIVLILYYLKFFAGGDAKLLIILGASVGYPDLFYLFVLIFIVGGFQALVYKYIFKQIKIPYAVSILLGYIIYLFRNLF